MDLAELLFGGDAVTKLLSHQDESRRDSTSTSAPLLKEPSETVTVTVSPKTLVMSLRQIITESEVKIQRMSDNRKRQAQLKVELEELENEATMLATTLCQYKAERQRLRSYVSKRELEFLDVGQDLVQDGAKRVRFTEDSGSEDGDPQQ